jgi:hypothetical protein
MHSGSAVRNRFGRVRSEANCQRCDFSAIVDSIIRAERLHLLQLRVINFRRDDANGREHVQWLNGYVSESADAELEP